MNILLFGQTGQVAREIRMQAEVTALGRAQADLNDPAGCAAAILSHRPDVVINAAAYTAVDRAESEPQDAHRINADAPTEMAKACAALGIPFLHISTDYVFAGTGTKPWTPQDAVAPSNVYGRTKLAGEEGVRNSGARHAILRTSWVFSAHGANFVKTMLKLSQTRDALTVVDDQIGGPTPARAIAAAILQMAQAMHAGHGGGTYHFAGTPVASWADFAREIFAQAERTTRVTGIPTTDYPTPAARPLNSRLDCASLQSDFGIMPPDWKDALRILLKDLSNDSEAS